MKTLLLLAAFLPFSMSAHAIGPTGGVGVTGPVGPVVNPNPTPTPTPNTQPGGGTGGVSQGSSGQVLVPGGLSVTETNLSKCLAAPIVPAGQTRPAADYDCLPTPQDSSGKVTGTANTNYKNWNGVLYNSNSSTPVNGFYTKDGTRCSDATVSSNACPIAVKVLYKITCDSAQMQTGKCPKALSIDVYHAIYQDKIITGESPIKAIIVGDSNVDSTAIASTPISISSFGGFVYQSFNCSSVTPAGASAPYIQLGTDQYGAPICGTDPNQEKIDAMAEALCNTQKQQVLATGGSTTTCTPNISMPKLLGGVHTVKQCLDLGGTLTYPTGAPVTNNTMGPDSVIIAGGAVGPENLANYQEKYICKMNGASCASGFTQHQNWSTTAANTVSGSVTSSNSCPNPAVHSVNTGSHAYSNAAVESAQAENRHRKLGGGGAGALTCGTDITGYSSGSATVTQIGCK